MISATELLALRLAAHHLSAPRLCDPAQLVAHLGAVQAQDYPAATWALALRLASDTTNGQIEEAFTKGEILRTHVLRPTWHFVAPADVRWMLALTAPRIKAAVAGARRSLGLDETFLAHTHAIIARALEGGNALTRPELGAALSQAGFELDARRLQYVVFHAELDAVVISGPPRGKQQTYALLDERVPQAQTSYEDRDGALAELTWRYFNSHGPALVADCSWWSGLTTGDIKRGLDLNRTRLHSITFDDRTYWTGPASEYAAQNSSTVHLLANYDEYTVAYRSRELYFDVDLNRTGNPREDVPFRDVIVACGKVAGRWKRAPIETTWWIDASRSMQRDLQCAARRYAAFR